MGEIYNFDPYNVLLAIATNIPVLLMTAFVLQGHMNINIFKIYTECMYVCIYIYIYIYIYIHTYIYIHIINIHSTHTYIM